MLLFFTDTPKMCLYPALMLQLQYINTQAVLEPNWTDPPLDGATV